MADATHTPGPWRAEPADMFGDHNIVLDDNSEDSRAVSAVVSNLRAPDEVAANARLIAAAPELLSTLGDCLIMIGRLKKHCQITDGAGYTADGRMLRMLDVEGAALATLAKALGS